MTDIADSKVELVIMKFGGSCLQDDKSYIQTSEIIKRYLKKSRLVIVASAMKSVTDKLINFYNKCCIEELENDSILNEVYNRHRKLILINMFIYKNSDLYLFYQHIKIYYYRNKMNLFNLLSALDYEKTEHNSC